MKSALKRAFALLLATVLLLSNVSFLPSASAAALFYGDYTDVKKIYDSNSCPSMQGLAVGSQYLYAIKIGSNDTKAVITRTDKDTGSSVTLTDASTGYSYFTGLNHANDMAVWGIDSKSHLFVATTLEGSNAIIRYRVNGTTLEKVASYHLTCDGADICATAMDIMKVDSNGYIHFITKWGQTVYTGTIHKDAGSSPTVAMTELCVISKEMAYIKGEKLDLSDWINQGFGYYDNTLFVPVTGPDGQDHRSVVLVYDLNNVPKGATVYPTDSVVFRVTSGAYSALFEIESVDICSSDKKLYFNTNRRVTDTDTNYDGISSFNDYTYTKPAAASFDTVKHFHAEFLPNGGTGTMEVQRINNGIGTALSANAYTKTGYTFAGWRAHRLAQDQWYYSNGTTQGWYAQGAQPSGYTYYVYRDTQKVSATSNVHEDTVEFVAQWKPIDYTVTWTIDGEVYATTTAHYGDTLTAPAYTAPSGYTFSGWSVPATMPAQNLTLDATLSGKTSTVTWVVDGKTTTETYDYGATPSFKGSTDKAPNGCTRYTFNGWDKTIAAVTGNVTYTAVYTSSTEHSYQSVTTDATCTTPAYTTYTCTACGDTYTEYEGTLTDWTEVKPENVPEEQVETKTQYRYSDKSTTTSSSATLDGYTLESSAWDSGTAGTVQYVKSWPSGFSTSNSLYSTYNKTPKTASETANTKVTINSNTVTGYLYYHWCYTDSYYSVESKQDSYTTFHAFYSTQKPSECTNYDSTDGSYYFPNTSCCGNSEWYWYAEVNTQKYTTYNKIYTHAKWSDWSDWSDTPVTATDTRQVESRTLYRYVDAKLGDHSYSTVVTKPTCTEDGYTTYTCSVCGDTYTESISSTGHNYVSGVCTACGDTDPNFIFDYYLIGFINGADYGCEGDYANMGEYKFVDGTLTATFEQDSYVFIKTTGNAKWYMTSGWLGTETTTATLYNTASGLADANKLFVPGGVEMIFTLTVNADDTLTLSYAPTHVHDYKKVVTAPTCTEDGYTTYTCSCSDTYTADPVDALGHTEVIDAAVDPTCTAAGKTEGKHCSVCGTVILAQAEVSATGHSYKAVVTAPTCTEDGYTTHTCSGCGDSYVSDEVSALGHNYVDGTCTVCGAADPDYTPVVDLFTINLAQVELGNALNLNFLFTVDSWDDWTGCYAVLTKTYADGRDNVVITVPADQWEDKTSGGKQYKKIGFHNISAKEMADEISIVVYNADGVAISNQHSDSIVGYLERMLGKNSNAEFRTLAVDMLNYGAAAQTQFNYNLDNLANANIGDYQQYATATDAVCVNNQVKGNNVRGASVSLENNIVMNVYFTNQTADMTAEVTFKNHAGTDMTVVLTSVDTSNGYCFQIDKLAVADMRTMVTITCKDADGNVYGTLTDSVEGYVARTGATKAINQAIMKFSDSAYAYLH